MDPGSESGNNWLNGVDASARPRPEEPFLGAAGGRGVGQSPAVGSCRDILE